MLMKRIGKNMLILFLTITMVCGFYGSMPLPVIAADNAIADGEYYIYSKQNDRLAIAFGNEKDAVGAYITNNAEGTKGILIGATYTDKFKFQVNKVGDKYTFKSVDSGFMITAVKNGWAVVQMPADGSDKQLFNIEKNNDGSYKISWQDKIVFDISGGKAKSGAEILLYEDKNADNQKFQFVSTAKSEEITDTDTPEDMPVTGLYISKAPNKVVYEVGESFDPAGMTVLWRNVSNKNPSILAEDRYRFSISDKAIVTGYKFQSSGDKIVKVDHFNGVGSDSFAIRVVPKGEKTVAASPSSANLIINGNPVNLDSYTISSNTYFKLRDIAMAVKGTQQNFSLDFNADRNQIIFTKKAGYTPVGGEMKQSGVGPTTATISNNFAYVGKDTLYPLKCYLINGNNYVGLRDLSKVVDMSLGWDGAKNAISLNSNKCYLVGEKNESSTNPLMTIVRGLRLNGTPVSELIALYGEPDEIQNEMYSFTDQDIKDKYIKGMEKFYFYKLNWKDMLIAVTTNDVVTAVYTNTNETYASEGLNRGYMLYKFRDVNNNNAVYASYVCPSDYPKISDDTEGGLCAKKVLYYTLNGYLAANGRNVLSYNSDSSALDQETNNNQLNGKIYSGVQKSGSKYTLLTGESYNHMFGEIERYIANKDFKNAIWSGSYKSLSIGYTAAYEVPDGYQYKSSFGNTILELHQ